MKRRGILIVVSGFSGAGKGTLMKELLKKYENYALSISATTRTPRVGEEEGEAYFFKTEEQFEKMIARDELIEYANYVGNYYGTPRSYVEQQLASGKDVILEIELQGALKIRKQFPETLMLFITPANVSDLLQRLVARGTESEEVIRSRMERAFEEAQEMACYDHVIINEDLHKCVDDLHQVVQAEHLRTMRNQEFIAKIQKDLGENVKGE